MKTITPSILAILGICFLAPHLRAAEPVEPKSKISLFDGKSLDGWKVVGDPAGWSAKDGVLATTGQPNGYVRTVNQYRNYRLSLEWRWTGKPTNSGVLLHTQGPDKVWPKCVEAQLMHENAGDFWLLNHSSIMVNGNRVGPKDFANAPKRGGSAEKPPGEWNQYHITCNGDKVTLVVNGRLMNEGTSADPSSGTICLQSEGSPIQFRNIVLEPLEK